MSKYKIGLFGFGCVGQGLYETLAKNDNIDAEVSRICVKNINKERSLPKETFEFDPNAIINDDNINLIVELIDDADFAFEIVKKSLKKGKAVVSANKKMIADNLEELLQLQKEYNTPILYEGAVCGSIPILRTLEDYYSSEKIHEISGIFNGSTNYILTKVIQENKSYEDALKEAQDSGFAETDPTMDVGGFDPKYKLIILIYHAFGIIVKPEDVVNEGIQNISKKDIEFAKERGLKIKLLSKAVQEGDKLFAYVAPHFVVDGSPLYHVENEYNSVLINGEFAENQSLTGKGAGKLPTGLAVLSDVAALTNDYTYNHKRGDANLQLHSPLVDAYVSFTKPPSVAPLFEEVYEEGLGEHNYAIGKISLKVVEQLRRERDDISIIFGTGSKKEVQIPEMSYRYE